MLFGMAVLRLTAASARVLRLFLDDPRRPKYALALMKATGLPAGTVHRVLTKMERAGWISSVWEDVDPHAVGRPPRRYFLLEPDREDEARRALADLVGALTLEPDREASG